MQWFPWLGTRGLLTLELHARCDGISVETDLLSITCKKTSLGRWRGHLESILRGDRSALDLAQHMSGSTSRTPATGLICLPHLRVPRTRSNCYRWDYGERQSMKSNQHTETSEGVKQLGFLEIALLILSDYELGALLAQTAFHLPT